MNRRLIKTSLGATLRKSGSIELYEYFQKKLRMPYLRGVNYHSTPKDTKSSFQRQLDMFSKKYENIDESKLESFFSGDYDPKKPGLLICLDDGFEDNYHVANKLLNKYGFKGWFFVIVDKIRDTVGVDMEKSGRKRYMTWDQVKKLAGMGHTIGCHTLTHRKISALMDDELEKELILSKMIIEDKIEDEVTSFCYPFGFEDSYDARAIPVLRENYKYLFTSIPGFITRKSNRLNIGRSHIESNWGMDLVSLVSSGLMDIKYLKRRAIYSRMIRSCKIAVSQL